MVGDDDDDDDDCDDGFSLFACLGRIVSISSFLELGTRFPLSSNSNTSSFRVA